MPKIRNIIIFIAIGAALVLAYVFIIKPSFNAQPALVSSSATATGTSGASASAADGDAVAQNFLGLLFNVRNIKLNVGIFSDSAFASLHDSSVTLTPDTTIGRPNPFAQFGVGDTKTATNNTTTTTTTTPSSPLTVPKVTNQTTKPAGTTPATH